MKKSITIIFYLIGPLAFGQSFELYQGDTINYVDSKNKKQGDWIVFSKKISLNESEETEFIALEGNYINDKKEGVWTKYYYDGIVQSRVTYQNSKPNGACQIYFENGNLKEKGNWLKNRWVGEYKLYFENGSLRQHFYFNERAKRTGVQKYYYDNQQLKSIGEWKNGKEQGFIKVYNSDGSLRAELYFDEGKEVKGESKFYEDKASSNDIPEETVTKSENKKKDDAKVSTLSQEFDGNGYFKLYNKNKQISKEGIFINYTLYDGKWVRYDEDGNLKVVQLYKKGHYVGDEDASLVGNKIIKNESSDDLERSKMLASLKELSESEKVYQQIIDARNKEILKVEGNLSEAQNVITEIQLESELRKAELARKSTEVRRQRTIIFSVMMGLLLVVVFFFVLYNRFRVIQRQTKIIEKQKTIVDDKNKEITDSIRYSKRIQDAILPPPKLVKELLKDSFVLYKPKDIVAGDFYWMESYAPPKVGASDSEGTQEVVCFAAADCTGHGVPGAMLSVMCSNALSKSVKELGIYEPAKILDKVVEILEERFSKSEEDIWDGMDLALCSLDMKAKKLEFAGANNQLYLIRNGELNETKGDRQPVGRHDNRQPFTNHTIDIETGDSIYLSSDGYPDQFGGPKDKKFGYRRFRELLLTLQDKGMEKQKDILDKTIEDWKGDTEQIDDICVIGVNVLL